MPLASYLKETSTGLPLTSTAYAIQHGHAGFLGFPPGAGHQVAERGRRGGVPTVAAPRDIRDPEAGHRYACLGQRRSVVLEKAELHPLTAKPSGVCWFWR